MLRSLILLALVGCSAKDTICNSINIPASMVADLAYKELGCDINLVKSDIESSLKKVIKCDQVELKTSVAFCSFVPGLVGSVGEGALKRWNCKNAQGKIEDVIKKALGCQ